MELRLYSIYDVKAKIWEPPCYCHNHNDAMRMFTKYLQQANGDTGFSMYASFPEDYQIFYLGTYNDENARFKREQNPEIVCTFADLLYRFNVPTVQGFNHLKKYKDIDNEQANNQKSKQIKKSRAKIQRGNKDRAKPQKRTQCQSNSQEVSEDGLMAQP